jgi:hypothetical protein
LSPARGMRYEARGTRRAENQFLSSALDNIASPELAEESQSGGPY